MERSGWGEIYTELGARPIINAIGSMTLLGGSTPPPEVRAAMEAANSAYIPMEELEARAGEVIARDDVLGMIRPSAAMIETMIGVVRLPGKPPTLCLSTMTVPGHCNRSPTSTIALVRLIVSSVSSGTAEQAVTNAERWTSL